MPYKRKVSPLKLSSSIFAYLSLIKFSFLDKAIVVECQLSKKSASHAVCQSHHIIGVIEQLLTLLNS
jgi:hypothetical protein